VWRWSYGLNSSGSEQCSVVGFWQYTNELLGYVKGDEYPDRVTVGLLRITCCMEFVSVICIYSDGNNNVYNANTTEGLSCIDSQCIGHNERLNIWHAGQHFIRLFLPLSAPASLEPHIQELLAAYAHPAAGGWDSARILGATQRLVARFVSGDYMARPSTQSSSTSGTCSILNNVYSWRAKYSQPQYCATVCSPQLSRVAV
jgi:hypothetical protein